jgi:transposase
MSPRKTNKRSSRKTRKKAKRARRQQSSQRQPKRVEIGVEELRAIVELTRRGALCEADHAALSAAVDTLAFLTEELEGADVTIGRLRKLLFGSSSEKTRDVLGGQDDAGGDGEPDAAEGDSEDGASDSATDDDDADDAPGQGGSTDDGAEPNDAADTDKKRKGHGRRGAKEYTGAERCPISHDSLKHGDRCPECLKGKVYRKKPAVIVRVRGVAPLDATVYEMERLRCNLCGEVFTARAPPGVGDDKYDETAAAMLALLRYGCGLPFNRLERLGDNLGIPLPSGTQWGVVDEAAQAFEPVWKELISQAASGEVVHIDDTHAQVLDLDKQIREELARGESERTGIFTTGVISAVGGRQLAVFFTGRKHAGENLASVLSQRSDDLPRVIQMGDALSRNTSHGFDTIVANCLTHARRNYVDVVNSFPDEVAHVLETLKEVYRHDADARAAEMSPEERLHYHQEHSATLMTGLEVWLQAQFDERKVEPNSTLGKAITYMQKHWDKLTLFLRVPGAPLDNNICERGLKRAILHRRNSLFYKTENGAHVGDLFMSLIHTAELCGVNPFDYFVAVLRHSTAVDVRPTEWMPWNYTEALAHLGEGDSRES